MTRQETAWSLFIYCRDKMILAAAFVIAKIYRQICTIIFLNLLNKGHYARIRMFYVRIGKIWWEGDDCNYTKRE